MFGPGCTITGCTLEPLLMNPLVLVPEVENPALLINTFGVPLLTLVVRELFEAGRLRVAESCLVTVVLSRCVVAAVCAKILPVPNMHKMQTSKIDFRMQFVFIVVL